MVYNDLAMLSCDNLALNFLSTKPTLEKSEIFPKLHRTKQLSIAVVCALNGKYIISSLNTIIILEKVQRVQVPYAQGSCLEAK